MKGELVQPAMGSLLDAQRELQAKLKNINEAVSALQAICEHDYVYSGHDSHYSYEVCKYCQHERSY